MFRISKDSPAHYLTSVPHGMRQAAYEQYYHRFSSILSRNHFISKSCFHANSFD
jgi:hypothetical protein